MSFFEELKRRNVLRVAAAYIVAAWLVIQVAETIFPLFGLGDAPARITVIVLAIFFVPATIFAWAFELTPEGLKREHEVDRSRSITPQTGKGLDRIIMVVLAIAVGFFAFDKFVLSESRLEGAREQGRSEALIESFGNRSVAVLPFANRSNNADDAFFVEGIHDDILTELARIGSLRVISRTSVERFRNTTRTMQEIGGLLDVKTILEGGVQRADDRVRINVQLIEVSTDNHLWANNYDRELTTANIFAIQSEVSSAIASALEATLAPEEKQQLDSVPTESMAALEAYFLGRQAMKKRTSASLADAAQHFKRAIEIDPGYALAYVELANTYALQVSYSGLPNDKQVTLAKPLIEKALTLNDRLGEAYIAMTFVTDDRESRETFYKKGIELAPGYVQGPAWYGGFLLGQGRSAEALIQFRNAARLDPLSSVVKSGQGRTLQSLGRFDEARDQYESIIRIDPDYARAYQLLGDLNWFIYGRFDEAILRFRQAIVLDPGNPRYPQDLAWLWSDLGGYAEADNWLGTARAIEGNESCCDSTAMYLWLNVGDIDRAASYAEKILADRPTNKDALYIMGLIDSHAGLAERALERYRSAYPELLDNPDVAIHKRNYWVAVNFAHLLQATGDHVRANRLLDLTLAYIQTIQRLGIGGDGYLVEDVKIYTMQGRKDVALAALRQAVDEGWRLIWRIYLKHDTSLAALHSETEYQAIVTEVEADMAAQLKHVREMEANGEMAPIIE